MFLNKPRQNLWQQVHTKSAKINLLGIPIIYSYNYMFDNRSVLTISPCAHFVDLQQACILGQLAPLSLSLVFPLFLHLHASFFVLLLNLEQQLPFLILHLHLTPEPLQE